MGAFYGALPILVEVFEIRVFSVVQIAGGGSRGELGVMQELAECRVTRALLVRCCLE